MSVGEVLSCLSSWQQSVRARLGEATSVLGAPDLLRRLFELSARIYVSAVVRVLIFRGMIAAECMCGKHAAC